MKKKTYLNSEQSFSNITMETMNFASFNIARTKTVSANKFLSESIALIEPFFANFDSMLKDGKLVLKNLKIEN
jgi:hypothetical protein